MFYPKVQLNNAKPRPLYFLSDMCIQKTSNLGEIIHHKLQLKISLRCNNKIYVHIRISPVLKILRGTIQECFFFWESKPQQSPKKERNPNYATESTYSCGHSCRTHILKSMFFWHYSYS